MTLFRTYRGLMPLLFVSILLLFVVNAFSAVDPIAPVPDTDFWSNLFMFVQGIKGMSVMAIAVGVTQLLMTFVNTSYGSIVPGHYKLLIVLGLSVIASLLGSLASGLSLGAALLNGSVLAAVQVFLHQVYVQFLAGTELPPLPPRVVSMQGRR